MPTDFNYRVCHMPDLAIIHPDSPYLYTWCVYCNKFITTELIQTACPNSPYALSKIESENKKNKVELLPKPKKKKRKISLGIVEER